MKELEKSKKGLLVAERYQVGEVIGEGGMGCVYRGIDLRLQRPVAIKFLNKKAVARHNAEGRFAREAKIGARLNHPHIVQTLDFGRDEDTLFLVMELLEGNDLHDFLRVHYPIELGQGLTIARQVSAAMMAAHQVSLIHRDLKPENIFIESSPSIHARVVDFGMAIGIQENQQDTRLTQEGTVGGTPMYMSPEQLRGGDPQGASDVYSLGCVFYEIFAGTPPFAKKAIGDLVAQILYALPVPLREKGKHIPPVLEELVRRMLAKNPDDRPSISQVHSRLEAMTSGAQLEDMTMPMNHDSLLLSDRQTTESMGGVMICGDGVDEISIALRAAEIEVVEESTGGMPECMVILGADLEEIASMTGGPAVVIADAEPGDMNRLTQLLRLGVEEVLLRPIRPERVVKKVRRALRLQHKDD